MEGPCMVKKSDTFNFLKVCLPGYDEIYRADNIINLSVGACSTGKHKP